MRAVIVMMFVLSGCGGSQMSQDVPGNQEDVGSEDAGMDTPNEDEVVESPYEVGDWRQWSVQEPGPFNTGLRVFDHDYTLPTGALRSIAVYIWYPTLAQEGEPGAYLGGTVPDANVLADAPVAQPVHEAGHPVTVHSHGDRAFGGEIANRAQHATSHGWVVVSVDHTGNLLPDANETPFEHWYHRPLDVRAAMDLLGGLPADDPLRARTAVDRAILTGHSRGSYTVWSAAGATYNEQGVRDECEPQCADAEVALFLDGFGDERFVGVSPQAGTIRQGWFGEMGHSTVDVPVFFMSGSEDGGGTDEQWDRVEGLDFTWVEFEGGCHLTFTLGLLCNTLSPEQGWALTNLYSLAFGRSVLLGDDGQEVVGLLDGTVAVPKATVRVR